ncbi:uroporphyrinogen-III synthase [Lederbergia citrea]|uniref:Uroporphyrinogen-III synthase n=1 Tax=Lederbergia citrea TaxID=2833581 RepID=A0A942Z2J5_9BACI|nr:uroporphyrinogen-III synthase [Lederbergia citrea]MBS4176174.1 uroporphyrinogen-III synthase [Lederbergia citrea]MBS4222598.1 uroporphyrinogen-III synthase [Lederbergia citrea]
MKGVPQLPLKGKHVLITRGSDQGEKFCNDVASAGGIPYMIPLIDFRAHEDINAPYFISNIKQYDWIIFTSKNGVNYFFQHIQDKIEDYELINSQLQFAVVGEKTQEALNRYRLPSQFMPNVYTAEDFARDFFELGLNANRVLIPKGNLASTTIADSFRSRNLVADEWIVYDTYYPTKETDKLIKILKEDLLDVAAFTSPSTFNHFIKIVKQNHLDLHAKKLLMAAIGTVTKRTIEQAGFHAPIWPATFTIDHMFEELCDYFAKQEQEGNV